MKTTENTEKMVKIEYHADDYGMFPTQSRRILDCHVKGKLNGVSIMPNSSCLDECMSYLAPFAKDVAITVHLNLIEGNSLCAPEEVSKLVDANGVFCTSFGSLLLHSFLPDRNIYREQLRKELRAQIHAVYSRLEQGTPLRIDGHAHYHMLPVVFDALMDVIREEKLEVSYLRIPREYVCLYLRYWNQFRDFSFLNMAKVLILNLLSGWATRKYGDALRSMNPKVFLGVFLSGRMYRENVELVLSDAIELARKLGQDIEILAHPGGVYEEADIAQLTCAEDVAFLTSEKREREKMLFEAD